MKKVCILAFVFALCLGLSGCFGPTTISNVSSASTNRSESSELEKNTAGIGQCVTGDKWAISLLSAKTYTEIADEYYTDTPEEGKIFLVLFFEVENVSTEDDYFNWLNFESYVDGYNHAQKMLMNKPDGVDTLTGDVAAGKKLKGHLAWEVSPEWSELEVSYKDSLWTGNKAATFKVTPADITE